MEYGTPVIFAMIRCRGKGIESHENYIGILHGIFTQDINSIKVRRAKVYCATDDNLHTCDLNKVKTLDNKDINLDSILMPAPEAVARSAPKDLIIESDGTISYIKELAIKVRAGHLLELKPTEWTANPIAFILAKPPLQCHVMSISDLVYINGRAMAISQISVDIYSGGKHTVLPSNALAYDPTLLHQAWEQATTEKLIQYMEKYKAFVVKYRKHISTLYENRKDQKGK